MSRIAPALMASAAKGLAQGQPGSNGYWRRDQFLTPGTFTWTATKAGKIKLQALGTGAGANGTRSGASGAFGEKTLSVAVGDTLTIVVGTGGDQHPGGSDTVRSGQGTTTSISGTPVGATPLVLIGAIGASRNGSLPGTQGYGTGPWDIQFGGAVATAEGTGSPSSGSPFGPGKAPGGYGGAGWLGNTQEMHGGGSRTDALPERGGNGLTTFPIGLTQANGTPVPGTAEKARPFWDFRDVDSAGGTTLYNSGNTASYAEHAGPGAGGSGSVNQSGGTSSLGGGSGFSGGFPKGVAGFGAGGAGSNNATINPITGSGSKGGNGFVQLFWDEVA